MNKQKGFTIIELIVVIAIIAILAAIVLVNVVQYINKAHDATVEGNMATIATNAGAYYADNTRGDGAYTGFNTTNGNLAIEYTNPLNAIEANDNGGTTTPPVVSFGAVSACTATDCASNWCMSTPLKSTNGSTSWCMDATGAGEIGTCTLTTNKCAKS
jgi:prepilin-type N-terminal cleavage/methylation domain-containing protein